MNSVLAGSLCSSRSVVSLELWAKKLDGGTAGAVACMARIKRSPVATVVGPEISSPQERVMAASSTLAASPTRRDIAR
jgi:hypothetical protein